MKLKLNKECVICGEIEVNKFYKSDKSYCKACRRNLTKKHREESGKTYNYKKTRKQNREKYEKKRVHYCMSARIRQSLKNGKDGQSWPDLVGYDVEKLKDHLESQFDDKMNWNNYGKTWEIDHKEPIASFNIESYKDDDFKECWSLNNLRPLSLYKNRSNGAIFGNNRRNING